MELFFMIPEEEGQGKVPSSLQAGDTGPHLLSGCPAIWGSLWLLQGAVAARPPSRHISWEPWVTGLTWDGGWARAPLSWDQDTALGDR